jgi:hypothetical protein
MSKKAQPQLRTQHHQPTKLKKAAPMTRARNQIDSLSLANCCIALLLRPQFLSRYVPNHSFKSSSLQIKDQGAETKNKSKGKQYLLEQHSS